MVELAKAHNAEVKSVLLKLLDNPHLSLRRSSKSFTKRTK